MVIGQIRARIKQEKITLGVRYCTLFSITQSKGKAIKNSRETARYHHIYLIFPRPVRHFRIRASGNIGTGKAKLFGNLREPIEVGNNAILFSFISNSIKIDSVHLLSPGFRFQEYFYKHV